MTITRRSATAVIALSLAAGFGLAQPAGAQDGTVKVGFILPMTGPFASTGRQVEAGARLYMAEHGDTVAGKKIELIVRDDSGTADQTKRIAQELVVNEGVDILAGFGLTPTAFATAPISTQAKIPTIVTAAATSSITEKSPYITRTSFTLPQASVAIGRWAAENGIKKVVTLVADYAPGIDAQEWFAKTFEEGGGEIVDSLQVPVRNPDFAPFLQRVKDAQPDALFVFVPSGVGAALMKQFRERGLGEAGIRLIGTGDVTDDDILNDMGEAAIGTITAHHYSAAHPSPENEAFVKAFKEANDGMRPNFMGVAGYDGMALIYKALEASGGNADGDAFMDAVKGLSWTSPRGPVSIDPQTRDIIQNMYVREVKEVDGALWNVEFETYEAMKDPAKAG